MRSRGDPPAARREEEAAPSLGLGILLQASICTRSLSSLGGLFVSVPVRKPGTAHLLPGGPKVQLAQRPQHMTGVSSRSLSLLPPYEDHGQE